MATTKIQAEFIATNAISGTIIADNAITTVHIAQNAITDVQIPNNSIGAVQIALNTISGTQIAQNSVTTVQLANNSVNTLNIADDQVTAAKLASDAVVTASIVDLNVTTGKIANNAITAAKIPDGSITATQIGANAVTLAKMASLARGSILIGNSSADVTALGIGTNDYVLTSDGTDIAWEAAAGGTDPDGAQTFNESGADVDFRVESNNNANMLFVDGGNDRVGIANNAPAAFLDIATTGSTAKPLAIRITNAAATNYAWEIWRDNTDGDLRFGEELAGTDTTRVTFESGGQVGIGTTSPDARLDIEGMAAGEQALLITSPRNDALSNGLARINITDVNCPFHGLQIDHAGTGSALYVNGTITIPNYESGGGQGTAGTISHKTNNYMYITGGAEALVLGGATASESGRGTIRIPEGNNDMDFSISGLVRFKVRYDYVDVGGTTVDYGRLNIKSSGASHIRMWDAGSGNTIQLHTHSVNLRMVDVPNNDPCIQFEADGDIDIDGSYLTGGFDYAEYFESTDGTAIPVGTTVVLVNEKVRAATGSEQPLGVVRPGSDGTSVVGGSAGLRWTGKYLKDDYDGYLYDTVDFWVFQIDGEDKQCWSDRVPDGWVVPSEKRVTPMQRKRLNPDFVENLDSDGEQIYANRESRDEWNCIGLLGQVPITKGQVTNSNWTKLKDRSETVELWFIK